MKQIFIRIFSVLLAVGLLVGCGNEAGENNNQSNTTNDTNITEEEVAEIKINILISKNEGEETISEKEIEVEEGAILMDVLKENFDVEEEGGFINSIEGIAPEEGEKVAWMYFVNDEMAPVGAAEFELSDGDQVNFDLQSWE